MKLARRSLMLSAAALATGLRPAVAMPGVLPIPEAVAETACAAEFGYSFDGSLFEAGFASHAEAASAAASAGSTSRSAFTTAQITRWTMVQPSDLACDIAGALADGDSIGRTLVAALEGSNQDGDYEGEFGDACSYAASKHADALERESRTLVASALERLGHPVMAAQVAATGSLEDRPAWDDAVIEALGNDLKLDAQLAKTLMEWATGQGLEDELRRFELADILEHPASAAAVPVPDGLSPTATGAVPAGATAAVAYA